MKSLNTIVPTVSKTLWLLAGCLLLQTAGWGQQYRIQNQKEDLLVTGTSTLHDWEITAESKTGTLQLDATGELPAITKLDLSVEAESLKSGKESMDNNTYKALNTKSYKQIRFQLDRMSKIEIVAASGNRYKATLHGKLTIAGKTRDIDLECQLTLTDSQIVLKGAKPLLMTDFGIDPPKALLGTIKTGDQIEILFNTVWTR
ncbi:YceI family protein [Robiginitalea sp. M366]|uniref:YceI family protein n=1 Tax=Robiginitalea aestuariiviva TaxID=3036903 RepID=UPI00240E134A|nr:YceI family protein [Robiginitalea aestuariiviva]MDG1572749.1 YceI family protein [Robiginitalea aestuariiviva]